MPNTKRPLPFANGLLRVNLPWALLLGTAFIVRTAYDWLSPTRDFAVRSSTSTAIGVGILVSAGVVSGWRSRSVSSGTLAGVMTALAAAILSIAGVALLLAFRHDQSIMMAIRDSGGLGEAFTLPLLLLVPGAILGTAGGLCGRAARTLARSAT